MTFRFSFWRMASAVVLVLLSATARAEQAVVDKTVPAVGTLRNITATGSTPRAIGLADFVGQKKAVVFVFLSNRCGMTWTYTRQIAALLRDYGKRRDVAIVGVHSSFEETDREIQERLDRERLSLPLLDDKPKQIFATTFGVTVTPYFLVMDGAGVLRYRGGFDKAGGSGDPAKRPQYLRPALDAVLAGKPVTLKTTRALGCELTRRKTAKR